VSIRAPQDIGGERKGENIEKRKFPRIAMIERLWCETNGATILVLMANISRGGVFLQSPYRPEPGTQLLLSRIEGEDELKDILVEVVWNRSRSLTDRPGIGLRFIYRDQGVRLFEFFRKRLRKRRDSIPPVVAEWATTSIYAK
jgi:hypothetical protein